MEVKPGLQQTEHGVIPKDWSVIKLGEVGEVIRGASPRPKNDARFYGGSIPRLMVEDVTRDGKIVIPEVDFLTEEGAKRSRPCKQGTLTIVCSGTVGVPSFLGVDACIHDGFLALKCIVESVCDDYLYHQLCRLQQSFDRSATHGGVFTNLTTSSVREFTVPLPPTRAEQEAIADALSDADAQIESLEQLIAKKRQIKQGAMQGLLTGKRRLQGFRGEWKVRRLEELGEFRKGSGITREHAQSGRLPCVRYGEIYTTHHDYIKSFRSWISPDVAQTATPLKKGDLLFAGSGETRAEIGKCVAFVEDCEAYAGGDIVILRPRAVDSLFLGFALNTPSINRQKASRGQGDAVVHISASALAKIRLPLPEQAEQTAIATILYEMDAEITALEDKLAKARRIKQGMMQELLTGRIRLI